MLVEAEALATPAGRVVDAAIAFALARGPDDAADGLLETVRDLARKDGARFGLPDLAQLNGVEESLWEFAPFMPALARVLGGTLRLIERTLPEYDARSPDGLAKVVERAADARLARAASDREALSLVATGNVCRGDVVFLFGLGARQEAVVRAAARRLGNGFRVLVAGPHLRGTPEDEQPAVQAADHLRAILRSDVASSRIPNVVPMALSEAGEGLLESDHAFVLALGVGTDGSVITLAGGDLVAHTASGHGHAVNVLCEPNDLLVGPVKAVPSRAVATFDALEPFRFVTPWGIALAEDLADLVPRAHLRDDLSFLLPPASGLTGTTNRGT